MKNLFFSFLTVMALVSGVCAQEAASEVPAQEAEATEDLNALRESMEDHGAHGEESSENAAPTEVQGS